VQMATRSGGRLSDAAVLAEAMRVADDRRVQYYQRRADSVPAGMRAFSPIAARWVLARKASDQDTRSTRFKQHLGERHQELLNYREHHSRPGARHADRQGRGLAAG